MKIELTSNYLKITQTINVHPSNIKGDKIYLSKYQYNKLTSHLSGDYINGLYSNDGEYWYDLDLDQ